MPERSRTAAIRVVGWVWVAAATTAVVIPSVWWNTRARSLRLLPVRPTRS